MENIIVACNTLRDEIRFVVDDLGVHYPILWIDSGLHNVPNKLNTAIQDQINKIENVENIILLFGSCGNSLVGLSSSNARIIFPKVDDCISLFLGGNERRQKIDREIASYYFTRGYLRNEANIWQEYTYCVNKYGPEKAEVIFDKMLHNYERLSVIDTGAYKPEEILPEISDMAEEFNLTHEIVKGSLKLVYKAFSGEWDKDFVIIEPEKVINYDDVI
ncbi:DUF1638 domain-containing protein [Selenihalanaerobacter shriftii]|uniref:DUF1638 domain-containing protein n=1 Tax=Selenihalanaerobacter shriftii TaxID=142842 RepID=A0A1T4MUM3_9FIRM|nr:DUF1638 domain-containing protein [Selenihalanaerobacter shriftii]SJZ70673.1 Protein of unknown function [Selenihalanaerobacter shriftii]